MPRLVAKLAYTGLPSSLKKTCTLGLVSPRTLTCLPDVAHLLGAGVMLVFSDGDAHQISDLLRRASVAYVTNKTLLLIRKFPDKSGFKFSLCWLPLLSGICCVSWLNKPQSPPGRRYDVILLDASHGAAL